MPKARLIFALDQSAAAPSIIWWGKLFDLAASLQYIVCLTIIMIRNMPGSQRYQIGTQDDERKQRSNEIYHNIRKARTRSQNRIKGGWQQHVVSDADALALVLAFLRLFLLLLICFFELPISLFLLSSCSEMLLWFCVSCFLLRVLLLYSFRCCCCCLYSRNDDRATLFPVNFTYKHTHTPGIFPPCQRTRWLSFHTNTHRTRR